MGVTSSPTAESRLGENLRAARGAHRRGLETVVQPEGFHVKGGQWSAAAG